MLSASRFSMADEFACIALLLLLIPLLPTLGRKRPGVVIPGDD